MSSSDVSLKNGPKYIKKQAAWSQVLTSLFSSNATMFFKQYYKDLYKDHTIIISSISNAWNMFLFIHFPYINAAEKFEKIFANTWQISINERAIIEYDWKHCGKNEKLFISPQCFNNLFTAEVSEIVCNYQRVIQTESDVIDVNICSWHGCLRYE